MMIARALRRSCLLAGAILGIAGAAHAAGPDLLTRAMCKDAVPQVAREFAGLLEPVGRDGFCIAGDFNGDGRPDVIMVVKVLVDKLPASADVRTTYPFHDRNDGHGPKGPRQFLALHAPSGP